jgi:hypothetical protein
MWVKRNVSIALPSGFLRKMPGDHCASLASLSASESPRIFAQTRGEPALIRRPIESEVSAAGITRRLSVSTWNDVRVHGIARCGVPRSDTSSPLPRSLPRVGIVAGFFRDADGDTRQIEGLAQAIGEKTFVTRGQSGELIAE